jgi:hypothetical protein
MFRLDVCILSQTSSGAQATAIVFGRGKPMKRTLLSVE